LGRFAGGVHPLLNLNYSAEVLDGGSVVTVTGATTVEATFGPLDASTTADISVTLDLARLRIAHAKEHAVERMDAGFAAEAEATLRTLITELTASGLNEHFEIAEELEQLEHFANRIASRNLDNETRKEIRDQSFQGRAHNHGHLQSRGVAVDAAVMSLPVVQDASSGIELECIRQAASCAFTLSHRVMTHRSMFSFLGRCVPREHIISSAVWKAAPTAVSTALQAIFSVLFARAKPMLYRT
jgi:Ca-activated chloride channel family protein